MIKRLHSVTNFGIFEKILPSTDYTDFNRFNLFYGFNGSGKSTLSHLFSNLELKDSELRFPNSNWKFYLEDGRTLSENDELDQNLNVKVFDKGFISRNINWDESIKGILIISEDKNAEILELKKKKKERIELDKDIKAIDIKLNGDSTQKAEKGLVKNNNNFLTEAAKNIKQKFQLIAVEDKHLSNYNKTKLENTLISYKALIKRVSLTSGEIDKLAQTIKPQDKEDISFPDISIFEEILNGNELIRSIIQSKITSEVINELKINPAKANWAKEGLELHLEDEECAFCGNILSQKRIDRLNEHFSNSFKELQKNISTANEWINGIGFSEFPPTHSLFKEYQDEYLKLYNSINDNYEIIRIVLANWKENLEIKSRNPFEPISNELLSFNLSDLKSIFDKTLLIINKHKDKLKNTNTIIQAAKNNLEIEYVKEEIKRYDYYINKEAEDLQIEKKIIAKSKLDSLDIEIIELTKNVSTEALGATKFNNDLWKFLGRKDISLKPQDDGGYKIQRNNDPNTKGKHLSEGEKTAIAFVYFITKLKEEENKIEDSIIIVDDPISSFDSNNLFSSYSFLKFHCNEAKQLFVLTHNFNYYRLIKDWFDFKNKKQKGKHNKDSSKPETICNVYTIESQYRDEIRVSEIKNADKTLLDYTSEYHYLFKKLIIYSTESKLDLDKAYLCANASRKILETFLNFKHPKKSNDFKQLLEKGIKNTSLTDKEESIYRFINKYSHAQDFDSDSSDNQLDEGTNITIDILNLIKEIDQTHYNEMIDVCGN